MSLPRSVDPLRPRVLDLDGAYRLLATGHLGGQLVQVECITTDRAVAERATITAVRHRRSVALQIGAASPCRSAQRRPADRRSVALQIVDGATVLAAVYAEADAIAEPVEAPAEDPE